MNETENNTAQNTFTVEEQQLPFVCDLCHFICFSSDEQTKHILGHFKQRHCGSCDKLLIQIGINWYEIKLHVDEICDASNRMENNPFDIHPDNIKTEEVEVEPEHLRDDAGTVEMDVNLGGEVFGLPHYSLSNDWISMDGGYVENEHANDVKEQRYLDRVIDDNIFIPRPPMKVQRTKIKVKKTPSSPEPLDKVFICHYCNKNFNSRKSIQSHMMKMHRNHKEIAVDIETIKCVVCHQEFTNKMEWRKHKIFHISVLQKQDDFKFKCSLCRHVFKYEETLNAHVKVVHECMTALKCNLCEKTFKNHSYLISHAYAHSPHNEFACSMCNKSYKFKSMLNEHMGTHIGFAPIKASCNQCGKTFARQEEVEAHKQVVHEGKKLFECETCGRNYDNDKAFKQHKKTHFLDKICHVCGQCFSSMNRMYRHIRTHSGVKPFTCEQCGKSFTRKEHQLRHMHVHSGVKRYKCDVENCTRSYVNKGDLQQHQLTEHGMKINIKEFVCTVCSKVFVQNSLLTKHMHTHI